MKPNLLLLILILPVLLSGCSNEQELDPNRELMGMGFDVHYKGAPRGDDNDLYARYSFPTENEDSWHRLSSEPDDVTHSGGLYGCYARRPEWEGNWWIEVALYEEINGELINRQRWDIDCYRYWIIIDETGQMELHKGDPPWDRPNKIPGLNALTAIAGLFFALTTLRTKDK